MKYLAYLILILTIGTNLYIYFPETKILADPNDNIFQYSLLQRTNWVWENYGCPFSLSCLPNLTDHVVTAWAEGYPLPFYYSHVPQIATVASFNLIIKPISSLSASPLTLYAYYNWTKYLLLCFFPLSVFIALRVAGFNPLLSVLGAFFAAHFSTDGLYGIDPPSFLWRGYGLTSQLYGQIFMPLAIAFGYRALSKATRHLGGDRMSSPEVEESGNTLANSFTVRGVPSGHLGGVPLARLSIASKVNRPFWTILFLTLTTVGHLGIGMLTYISLVPFIFISFKPREIIARVKMLALICLVSLFALSYWIIPTLLQNKYHLISFWDPIWKFDSYGWYESVRQYLSGELFDWGRIPLITILASIGFFTLMLNSRLFPFALLFAFWFLLYFGRTTWGGIIDLIPGMKDFHQHRFLVGIQVAALFLIPGALEWLYKIINTIVNNISYLINSKLKTQNLFIIQSVITKMVITFFISLLAYLTIKQTINYNSLNTRWIGEANSAYLYEEKNYKALTDFLGKLPQGRVYAGRPGNWGHDLRLGSTQMYMVMAIAGFDVSQFLPETWSPMSENEQNFDERVAEDYDLLNIRYIVSDKNHDFTSSAQMIKQFGPYQLYEVPTTGWFDVVSSPMMVVSDKTDFLNIVYFWHRSYPRRWNMHPLISVENNPSIPPGVQKVIKMEDEVSYKDITSTGDPLHGKGSPDYNIFSNFPFVFPEATVSGKIVSEKIEKQAYSALIDVPDPCPNCGVMFKMSFHPNWKVKVDGQIAQKYSVFPFYLATSITPGNHTVEFYYQPSRLKVILLVLEILVALGAIIRIIFLKIRPK